MAGTELGPSVSRRGLLLTIAAGVGAVFVAAMPSSATPTAQQRYTATASVTFSGSHGHSWLINLDASGPTTGVPSDQGFVDVSLRSCVGNRCSAPTTYRAALRPGEFSSDQRASTARLSTTIFGRTVRLAWSTSSDYVVSPTLVLYNHFLTGGGQAGVLIPAVRDAAVSGSVFGQPCNPVHGQTSIETDAGNIPSDGVTRAPTRWPIGFEALGHARCR